MTTDDATQTSVPTANSLDRYQRILLLLMCLSAAATVATVASTALLADPLFLDVGIATGVATGVLLELILEHRSRLQESQQTNIKPAEVDLPVGPPEARVPRMRLRRARIPEATGRPGFLTGLAGLLAVGVAALQSLGDAPARPSAVWTLLLSAAWIGAAGLAGAVVRYLGNIAPSVVPEGPALCRGARVLWWLFLVATVSIGLVWIPLWEAVQVVHWLALGLAAAVGAHLVRGGADRTQMPLDIGIISILGSRLNILASVLDSADRQLGIDLRSTWALTIVRRGAEPLAMALAFIGWLSTSITVVGTGEQSVVERFGVPVSGVPLAPGLHAHWPWPVDRADRVPVARVQTIEIGHEGQEAEGPENVLWAVQHAPVEFTLLLGDGRDLITIDAGVQFRIRDPRAWRYNCQNPVEALSALGYRAVTRSTVNRTLSEALSENVATLTLRMRDMIQQDADALGLGVEVLGFTVGGMHPPVPVATDYQAVVSAELRMKTAVVGARTFRTTTLSESEGAVLLGLNGARAAGAQALGTAAGEAWAFRALESQFRAAPDEYFFRRRLETLEYGLAGRNVTVVDSRIERDGGELWIGR